tara:strand:+ start:72 stop:581 length:510 start_codon:yes stop_codon:yes gene_type:complete
MAGLLEYYEELLKRRQQNPSLFEGVPPLGTPEEFELKYGDYDQSGLEAQNKKLYGGDIILGGTPKASSVVDVPVEKTKAVSKESGDPSWYNRSKTMLWASLLGDEKMPRAIRSGRKLGQHDPVTPGLDVKDFAPANLPYDKGIQGLSRQEKSWRSGDDEDFLSILRGLV